MKITGLFLALMMMASVCFAQQTATVYSRVVTGSVSGVIPETDGIDNISLQKSANRVLNNETAWQLPSFLHRNFKQAYGCRHFAESGKRSKHRLQRR